MCEQAHQSGICTRETFKCKCICDVSTALGAALLLYFTICSQTPCLESTEQWPLVLLDSITPQREVGLYKRVGVHFSLINCSTKGEVDRGGLELYVTKLSCVKMQVHAEDSQ